MMINIQQNAVTFEEFEWDDELLRLTTAERDEEIARRRQLIEQPTCCPRCARPLVNGDCDPCQISFSMPF